MTAIKSFRAVFIISKENCFRVYHKRKHQFCSSYWVNYVTKWRKASVLITYQRILTNVTLITVQSVLRCSVCTIQRVSKRIYCLSDNFIISSYAVSGRHALLQDFFSFLPFLLVDLVLHVSPREGIQGREMRWPARPGLWTKTSSRFEEVVFARGGPKRDSGSWELMLHSVLKH
jgi:hypothetical protein